MDPIKKMISKALDALEHSYAPYSNFHVGCCIQSEQGNFYTGINVENASYSLTLCAESSAIAQMVTAGDKKIKKLIVLSDHDVVCSPCGACRQRIHEFSTNDTEVYLCNRDQVVQHLSINELLPLAFKIEQNRN